jgi:exopolysaccharide production protein ExoQ
MKNGNRAQLRKKIPAERVTAASTQDRAPTAEWIVAVFAAIVQQGAFLSIPLYFGKSTLLFREEQNEFNTIAVTTSLLSILIVCILCRRRVADIATKNGISVVFLLLVFGSAFWSIHPELTLRRGVGYLLTLLVAMHLTARFDLIDRMKVLSYSFAISAIGSLLFVVIFPSDGIMSFGELSGTWRGVFTHKNILGPTMAAAVFVELLILSFSQRRMKWRYGLLGLFLLLVILSRSTTGLLLSTSYLVGAFIYALGKRSSLLGTVLLAMVSLTAIGLLVLLYFDAELLLSAFGKDPTLTGRTGLWTVVMSLIAERPILGYGYRAMWVLNDASTVLADQEAGGWGVASSHNAFLELTLQLGYLGMGVMLAIIVVALVRAYKCWLTVPGPLGFFSLVFVVSSLLAAQTMETLGQNQVIEWVIFNLLLFGCGMALRDQKAADGSHRGRPILTDRSARLSERHF